MYYSDLPKTFPTEEISFALSKICRFTGNTEFHYSVAEHSVLCARLARSRGYEIDVQLAALFHDAPEAYLGDVPGPLKRHIRSQANNGWMRAYEEIDNEIFEAIMRERKVVPNRFMMSAVKRLDRTVLSVELASVFDTPVIEEGEPDMLPICSNEAAILSIAGLDDYEAHLEFMRESRMILSGRPWERK